VKKNRDRQVPPQDRIEKVYQVGLYVRLSLLDSGKKDSDTVETQEELLQRFISGKPYFSLYSVYIDNGETGVNFQRSGFQRLMEDVRAGRVNCIIVKDLSRLGRNYIETGEYLENVFPFLGVRFIAVNDSYDSMNPTADTLSLHLKNLVNDVYARDISAKIGPVIRTKQERGEFMGTWAAYGYRKSPEDPHKLMIDEKTAPIVHDIFTWRLGGLSYRAIVCRLTELGILSPGCYRYREGIVKGERFANTPWHMQTIKRILENEVYLGHTVQGRKRGSLFLGQKQEYLSKDEWIIVRNTHEAIIDQETFDLVQRLNNTKNREYHSRQKQISERTGTEHVLEGLVCCGECKTKMVRYRLTRRNKQKEPKVHVWYNYICRVHAENPMGCSFRSVREEDVLKAVSLAIRGQVCLAGELQFPMGEAAEKSQVKKKQEALGNVSGWEDKRQEKHRLREEKYGGEPGQDSRLTRETALALIEKVTVYGKDVIHIDFRFQDEYKHLKEAL